MKRPLVIGVSLIVGLIALGMYFNLRPPAGVTAKGGADTAQWVALAISVVSLLTGLTGLVQKLIELKIAAKRSQTGS